MSLLFWKYAGPASLVLMIGLLTIWFKHKGLSWRDFGLVKLHGRRDYLMLLPKALLTFIVFAMAIGITVLLQDVLQLPFMSEVGDGIEARWGDIRGNLGLFLLWIGIAWTAAAFGEEMVFRGYLINRLNTLLGHSHLATVAAVMVAAVIFGYGHYYYQGLRGFVMISLVAIAFGSMFILFKRNLYPCIIVHGIVDSLSFCATYFGWEDV